MGGLQQVRGDEVVGVFRQLMLRESGRNAVDGGGRDQQEQEPAEHLQGAVETLEDNPNLKGSVEQVVGPKPAPDTQFHWARCYMAIGSRSAAAVSGVLP